MGSTTMDQAQRQAFLCQPYVAVLSLAEPGRGPLAVPVWYDYRPGEDLWFLTQRDSRKGRLLAEGVRVSLLVQDIDPPYRYVGVEGPVSRIEPYDIDRDLKPMAVRYLGARDGTAYADASRGEHAEDDGIRVSVRPEHWLSADFGQG